MCKQLGNHHRRQAQLGRGWNLVERSVLSRGGVDQRRELIDLQKRTLGLGNVDTHTFPTRVVAFDVLVFDRVLQDRRKRVDGLTDRTGRKRHDRLLVRRAGASAVVSPAASRRWPLRARGCSREDASFARADRLDGLFSKDLRALGYAADSDATALRQAGADVFKSMEELPAALGLS